MRKDRYNLEASDSFKSYEFTSEGPKGRISKIVKYTETDIENYYNLGFGNKLSGTDDFDDTAISNNLIEVLEHFTIFGLKDDVWERYEINQPYTAFLITRKWNIL